MADITLTIPDAEIPRVRAAFRERVYFRQFRAPPHPDPLPDPTLAEMKREVMLWLKAEVLAYEQRAAAKAASDAVPDLPVT